MKTVLIATDFSPSATNAVWYGARLAGSWEAKIILVHAFSLPLAGYDSMAPLSIISEMQSAAQDALRELKKELQSEIANTLDIQCIAEPGASETVITEMSERFGANLVVLGMADKTGALKKHVLGSTVTDSIHALKIPVLIVPEFSVFKGIESIVFAVDPNWDEDLTAFMTARNFTELLGAKLEVLSILGMQTSQAESEALREKLNQLLKNTVHKTSFVRAPEVATGLEEYISTHNPDLVMLHPRHHGLFSRLFETGITARLVYSLKTPILSFHA